MITDSDVIAPPVTQAQAVSLGSPPPRISRTSLGRFSAVKVILAVGLFGGVVGFNVWWYLRDTRPVPDLRAIEAMIVRKQYDQAEAALRERLRRAPHDGEARTALGRALAVRGDLLACARELDRLPYWWPQKSEALFRGAQAYLMSDRARDAESSLLAILDGDPLHPADPAVYHDAGQELMKLYATENRWEDFYGAIWKAYDHAPPQERPVLLGMRIRSELERVSQAESLKVLRRYAAADPADFEALRALANAELAVGQKTEAVRDMEACLRARPDDPRVWRDYLTMLHSLGDVDAFNAALARVPSAAEVEPEIWVFCAEAREREGDWSGAAEQLRQALERNPNLVNAHYRMAIVEDRLGRREESDAHRKRWKQLLDARTALRQADAEYQAAVAAAAGPGDSGGPALRASIKRLAALCETLGWARAAEGWNKVAATL